MSKNGFAKTLATVFILSALAAVIPWNRVSTAAPAKGAIHFDFQPITLDSCETPQRHAPETMAGGVAVFGFDGDGNLDIFFTNGADISTLKKTSPK